MTYTLYVTNSIERLVNEKEIATAQAPCEAIRAVTEYLESNNIYHERYMRYLFAPEATFIDYGSYSKFIAIVPPISIDDLRG